MKTIYSVAGMAIDRGYLNISNNALSIALLIGHFISNIIEVHFM